MSLWISSAISFSFLLLQFIQPQPEAVNVDVRPAIVEEIAGPSAELPRPLVFTNRDWNLTHAYSDVFEILSNQNTCSSFYGGSRTAITVLNSFVTLVKSESLVREVAFQMRGKPRLIHDVSMGVRYRLFDKTMVNSNGAFYQRRVDALRKFPSDVGDFAPGSRPARALILLHELGHLIEREDGSWLIPDDGYDGPQSKANTLRVQQACRAQLEKLQ